MASDFHIKFDGVEGEATHKDHKGEIEVLAWSWGVTNEAHGFGGGSGKAKAEPGVLKFSHYYDKSSPVLAKKCAQGVHFPSVKLTARKAGEGQKVYLTIALKEAYITSCSPSARDDGTVEEEVEVSYATIDFAYKTQDEKGSMGGEVKFGWEVKTTKIS